MPAHGARGERVRLGRVGDRDVEVLEGVVEGEEWDMLSGLGDNERAAIRRLVETAPFAARGSSSTKCTRRGRLYRAIRAPTRSNRWKAMNASTTSTMAQNSTAPSSEPPRASHRRSRGFGAPSPGVRIAVMSLVTSDVLLRGASACSVATTVAARGEETGAVRSSGRV